MTEMKMRFERVSSGYKLGCDDRVTFEIDVTDATIDAVLESFEDFLRGCGYVFDRIEVVNDAADD